MIKIPLSIFALLVISANIYSQSIDTIDFSGLFWNEWVHTVDGTGYRNCFGKKCNGMIVDTFQNGKIKEISNYVEGKKNGLDIIFHPNGQILMFGNLINGTQDGEWKSYYDNGKLNYLTLFVEGEVRKEIGYFQSGNLENGHEVSEDGYLLYNYLLTESSDTIVACFVSDWQTKTYKYVSYYDNGQVEKRGYLTGKNLERIGTWVYYDEKGKITRIEKE